MPNMVKIGLGVWAGPIPSLSRHWFSLCFFLFFLYSSLAVPKRPLDRSRRLVAHMMRFLPRKCLLGVSMTKN